MPENSFDDRGRAEVDDIVLEAPGLEGEVRVERPGPGGALRGSRAWTQLDDALANVGMLTEREIVVAGPRSVGGGGGGTRGAGPEPGDRPVMTLTVPGPRPGFEQAVLSKDEHGVMTWQFKGGRRGGRAVRGSRASRVYTIERTTVPTRGSGATRGIIPGLDKVIRVITFPIADAIGKGARFVARDWDIKRHPPRIRAYGPAGQLSDLDAKGWKRLSDGPVLLFVLGTFSTTEGGFGALPGATRRVLDSRYGGRVIAYDHPTIADDPIENARWFLEQAAGRALTLDIVCHSRGGLVSRAIAERPENLAALSPDAHVRSIVLVGVPSNGTILADANNWNELLDRATTLLNMIPGPGLGDALETVLAIVRSIAVRTANNLKGLDAMVPGGDFLTKRLNVAAPGNASYHAIVSDYEPKNPGLRAWLDDAARDSLFKQRPNDMMVTIESMTGVNGSSRFPVADRRAFAPRDGIEHARYFPEKVTETALLDWLRG